MDDIYDAKSGVTELKMKDFKITKDKIKVIHPEFKKKNGIIIFYAPWCIHCRKSKDMWSELALLFKNRFPIAAFNVEDLVNENYIIKEKMNIKVYPTLKYVNKNGTMKNYKTSYDKDNLLRFICHKGKISCSIIPFYE